MRWSVISRSEVRGLRDSPQVEALQDQAQIMLAEYAMSQYPASKVCAQNVEF